MRLIVSHHFVATLLLSLLYFDYNLHRKINIYLIICYLVLIILFSKSSRNRASIASGSHGIARRRWSSFYMSEFQIDMLLFYFE